MIENEIVAKEISDIILKTCEALNETTIIAQDRCPHEEFRTYRRAVAAVLAEINDQILNPLFSAHPKLEPSEPG